MTRCWGSAIQKRLEMRSISRACGAIKCAEENPPFHNAVIYCMMCSHRKHLVRTPRSEIKPSLFLLIQALPVVDQWPRIVSSPSRCSCTRMFFLCSSAYGHIDPTVTHTHTQDGITHSHDPFPTRSLFLVFPSFLIFSLSIRGGGLP